MVETLRDQSEKEPFLVDEYGRDKGNARSTYFYAWWTHIVGGDQSLGDRPMYSVHVESEEELALAQAVQPSIVDAEFYLRGERVEPSAEQNA